MFTIVAVDAHSNPPTTIPGVVISIKSGQALVTAFGNNTYAAKANEGTVTFEGEVNGCTTSISVNIVRPSGVAFEKYGTDEFHINGHATSGFPGEAWITPRNVSFCAIKVREGTAPNITTGTMDQYQIPDHPVGAAVNVSAGVDNKGCRMRQTDTIKSNYPKLANPPPDWHNGTSKFVIPLSLRSLDFLPGTSSRK